MADDRYVDKVVLVDRGKPHLRLVSANGEILMAGQPYENTTFAARVAVRLADQLGVPYRIETDEDDVADEDERGNDEGGDF